MHAGRTAATSLAPSLEPSEHSRRVEGSWSVRAVEAGSEAMLVCLEHVLRVVTTRRGYHISARGCSVHEQVALKASKSLLNLVRLDLSPEL